MPWEPFATRLYPLEGHASSRAFLSLGQLSFEDLKSPSGGNFSGRKYHFRNEGIPPRSDDTSLNKSCFLKADRGRFGD